MVCSNRYIILEKPPIWWLFQCKKVAYLHRKIVERQRTDYLHILSKREVENQDFIAAEDMKVRNLKKNHHLAKAVSDASWRTFLTMLQYKGYSMFLSSFFVSLFLRAILVLFLSLLLPFSALQHPCQQARQRKLLLSFYYPFYLTYILFLKEMVEKFWHNSLSFF